MTSIESQTHLHLMAPGKYQYLQDLNDSNLASIRLRSALVAKLLSSMGWRVTAGENIEGTPDILLIGKIGAFNIAEREKLWIKQITLAKAFGTKIFFDYTDNHLGFKSEMQSFCRSAAYLADHCITSSVYLANALSAETNCPVSIIPDPIEVSLFSAKKIQSHSKPKLLWFGHATNVSYLLNFIDHQLTDQDDFELIVLSNGDGLNIFKNHSFKKKFRIKIMLNEWSIKNMVAASKITDICIIPSDPEDPRKAGASSNRLITSLSLGLPTAVDFLPSYADFSDYCVNIRSSEFRKMLKDPMQFHGLVEKAQTEIVPFFDQEFIGRQWLQLLQLNN
jgi:hypothetical protein